MSIYEAYYRVFKTSWGILIGFRGEFLEMPDSSLLSNATQINDTLFFSWDIPEENLLPYKNRFLIENGIRWVANEIPSDKTLLINLKSLDVNFCNFQIEGLFFGIAYWICSYYNIQVPLHEVKYDSQLNKYLFSLNDKDKNWEKVLNNIAE